MTDRDEAPGYEGGREVRLNGYLILVFSAVIAILVILLFVFAGRNRRMVRQISELDYFRSLILNSVDGIVIADEKGVILEWNIAQSRITGIPPEDAAGKTLWEVQKRVMPTEIEEKKNAHPLRDAIVESLKKGRLSAENQPIEYFITRPDGERRFLQEMIFPIRTPRGFMLGSVVRDITGHGRLEEALSEFALVDELTGLYNRRGFLLLADQQYRQSRLKGQRMMVFYADLDNMKTINDTLGHKTGDAALKAAAGILRDTFRGTDIVARLGGDEFAAVAAGVTASSEKLILKRFREKLAETNAEGHPFELSVSTGYVYSTDGEFANFETILAAADKKMYEQKKERKKVSG